jgi:hypothetical protein
MMDSGKMCSGYVDRAKAVQALQNYPIAGWMAELNRAHVRDPRNWTLSVVSEILTALHDSSRTREPLLLRR